MVILCFAALMFAQSVDDVVAKAVKARGPSRKVQTERLTGKIVLTGQEGPLNVEFKRPGKMREMVTLAGKSQIRTTDGKVGWGVGTLRDAATPVQLSEQELKGLAGSADFEGPLVDYKAKGNKIELVGKELVEGKMAYKLNITMKGGEARVDFVDCKTYRELKWQGKVGDTVFESYFHDYRKVNGLMVAFEIDSAKLGEPPNQKIVFEKVEVNPPLDDARFGKP